jgi:protein tyrosine/serine phosphatase
MHRLSTGIGVVVIVGLIVGPVLLASRGQADLRNFRAVRDGVLYRSGQMTVDGLRQVIHDYGIRTVISLRDGSRPADRREEVFCAKEGYLFVRIPPRHWMSDPESDAVPAEEGVRRFREVLADRRNHPVLVHCFAGIHRTGAYVAVYRMEFEGWPPEQAIAEMRTCGYTSIDDELDVLGYLEGYRPVGKVRLAAESR